MASLAKDFDKIIKEGRERKKNEALADRIFSRDRRQSAPSKLKAPTGPSLASRVGVRKPPQQQRAARASLPSGNVNGEWTHDLHDTVSSSRGGGSLASRVTAPGAPRNIRATADRRKNKLVAALDRMDVDNGASPHVNYVKPSKPPVMGLSIRGLAGPYCVMAQNFAPGTTAADIESAMTPIGGEMVSCRLVKTDPIILVEMLFASREGGERVIETFNNKTADGRLIKVYPKIGGHGASTPDQRNNPPANAPNGPRSTRPAAVADDQVVDGTLGFTTDLTRGDSSADSRNGRPLYSDKIVASNRRGRGFQRGRAGR